MHTGDKSVQLTLMETEMFRYLIRNSGIPFPAKQF